MFWISDLELTLRLRNNLQVKKWSKREHHLSKLCREIQIHLQEINHHEWIQEMTIHTRSGRIQKRIRTSIQGNNNHLSFHHSTHRNHTTQTSRTKEILTFRTQIVHIIEIQTILTIILVTKETQETLLSLNIHKVDTKTGTPWIDNIVLGQVVLIHHIQDNHMIIVKDLSGTTRWAWLINKTSLGSFRLKTPRCPKKTWRWNVPCSNTWIS